MILELLSGHTVLAVLKVRDLEDVQNDFIPSDQSWCSRGLKWWFRKIKRKLPTCSWIRRLGVSRYAERMCFYVDSDLVVSN